MEARVKNVGVVQDITMSLEGTALLCGPNASGKSTVVEAVAAALCGGPSTRWGSTKKQLADAVRDGAETGVVRVAGDEAAVTVRYPSGDVETTGGFEAANAIVVGRVALSSLKNDVATKTLVDLLNAKVTRDDLLDHFARNDIPSRSGNLVWDRIQAADGDFDKVLKDAQGYGQQLKGQWKQITAVSGNYGARKALAWRPEGYDPDTDPPKAALEEAFNEAKEAFHKMLGDTAVSEDEVRRIREKAASVEAKQEEYEKTQKLLEKARTELQEAEDELEEIGSTIGSDECPVCPHCSKPVLVGKPLNGIIQISKPDLDLKSNDPKMADRKHKRKTALYKRDNRTSYISQYEGDLVRIEREIAECKTAGEQLAKVELRGQRQQVEMDKAKEAMEAAEAKLDKARKYAEADAKRRQVENNEKIQAALGPLGVRKTKLEAALTDFNARLADLSASIRCPAVYIDEDASIFVGNHLYSACAESWRWRADLLITMALAEIHKPWAIVVDRLDVIQQQDRGVILKAIREQGIPAIVTMMAGSRDKVPNVEKAGLAKMYWIEEGAAS